MTGSTVRSFTVRIPPTVVKAKRKPRRVPARKPVEVDLDGMPPLAASIVRASSHARRADIVLRLPDAVLLVHAEALMEACRVVGFEVGASFLAHRLLSLHSPRRADGRLLEGHESSLAIWRNGLAAVAGRETDPLATQADREAYEGQV